MAGAYEKQKAAHEKEKGNSAFKAGKYNEAIDCYSRGIEIDKSQPILFCNRAMALLKINRFFEAKLDCDEALKLDAAYVKAYFRRGLVHASFNDVDHALADFEKVLLFDPQNKEAKKEIEKLNQIMAENSDKLRQVLPIEKPKHLTAKKLTKIAVKQKQNEKIATESSSPSLQPPPPSSVADLDTAFNENEKYLQKLNMLDDALTITSSGVSSLSQSVPKTAFHFLTGWRSLKHDGKKFCSYLLQIPTSSYSNVIDSCLEPVLITDILNSFAAYGESRSDKPKMFQCLKKLTELKNFKRCKLFFDDNDLAKMDKVLEYLGNCDPTIDESDLADLKRRYAT